jgi:hypothetical protein
MPASPDPLTRWLGLDFTGPERRYNPEVRDFLAELLGYPKNRVVTEGHQGEGFPDVVLLTEKGDPWVVGDFKKDDSLLQVREPTGRILLELDLTRETTDTLRQRRAEMEGALQIALPETRSRLLARLEGEYPEALKALFEKHLPRFADQYGREVEGEESGNNPRTLEALPWPREPRAWEVGEPRPLRAYTEDRFL